MGSTPWGPGLVMGSLLFLAWVLIGYPLFAVLRARLFAGTPIRRGAFAPSVTVVLPVRNGAAWLDAKLQSLLTQAYPPHLMHVIVVSDGSTDATDAIVERVAAESSRVTLLRVPRGGKAAALNAAMAHAQGEILLFTDVRQPVQAESLAALMENFADPTVAAVSGELRLPSDSDRVVGAYWRLETRLRDALSQRDSMLGATGPLYALRRSDARPVPSGIILDDMYLPLGAFFAGKRLLVDARAVAIDAPMDGATEYQRKVRTLAGQWQLMVREPRVLLPWKNRLFFDYVSYKVGRLLVPYALMVLAVGSLLCAPPLRTVLLSGQALVYGAALLDARIPAGSVAKRVTAPLHTLCALALAALVSLKILRRSAQDLWTPTHAS